MYLSLRLLSLTIFFKNIISQLFTNYSISYLIFLVLIQVYQLVSWYEDVSLHQEKRKRKEEIRLRKKRDY